MKTKGHINVLEIILTCVIICFDQWSYKQKPQKSKCNPNHFEKSRDRNGPVKNYHHDILCALPENKQTGINHKK